MYESKDLERMNKTQWKAPHYGLSASLLVVGLIAGRAFFPLEVPKAFIVEKEKRVEVPVERIVIQKEPFEVIKYVDRIVEKRVEVPVERRVEVPVEKIVYLDRILQKPAGSLPADLSSWRQLSKGLSRDQVRSILGEPRRINGGAFETWSYQGGSYVVFYIGKVDSWSEP
jgi:hypothetical protein